MTDHDARPGRCPLRPPAPPAAAGRRGLLLGLAGGGAALTAGTARAAGAALMQSPPGRDAAASSQAIPFHGPHQAGILNPPPAAGMVAAFDVLAGSREELAQLFQLLTTRIRFLMQGGTPPAEDPRFPPADSGILGPVILPDGLTVTVAVGASLFDERFGLAAARPRHLVAMPRFPNDAPDRDWCHGDLLLQICAHTPAATLHALRDILKNTPALLRLRWKQDGFLPEARGGTAPETPRNLLGFKDGTANLDPGDAPLMRDLVWVGPGREEPAWATGGSYQVVRIIRNFVERWDRTPLREQEAIFGRAKDSGAPLGGRDEHDPIHYADDPDGARIALESHIRLANPRTADTDGSRILRRPFNYSRGVTRAGQLDMGLLFICFQADLAAGFAAVQGRLNGERLEEYVKPTGGGYFFALPGVPDAGGHLGQTLLQS
ncbi:iron uptake transporter deferrochelatase/peroxidase subunit [Roseomonas haemaphysalidis]|uniref:Deferrochelatase n=1 Tax=Roseomonas haemaphysalidis TaxID=2768162 RepID=A0ABS3KUP5_9PROT|nr:iron uptake transporter deferrochelatase/peroxidase subunit [Roseomonas haemaphysalidis]MBO1081207.1 deferrochelatase/peroxidase EfeB [Roseomonas haemaphysalidis]